VNKAEPTLYTQTISQFFQVSLMPVSFAFRLQDSFENLTLRIPVLIYHTP